MEAPVERARFIGLARLATPVRIKILGDVQLWSQEQSERTVVAKPLCSKDNNGFRDGA